MSYLFALVVLPLTFLGCIYYPWKALEAVRWLQIVVLVNPLVYMCEGFRAALTDGIAAHEPAGRLRRADRCSPSCSRGSASTASSAAS